MICACVRWFGHARRGSRNLAPLRSRRRAVLRSKVRWTWPSASATAHPKSTPAMASSRRAVGIMVDQEIGDATRERPCARNESEAPRAVLAYDSGGDIGIGFGQFKSWALGGIDPGTGSDAIIKFWIAENYGRSVFSSTKVNSIVETIPREPGYSKLS